MRDDTIFEREKFSSLLRKLKEAKENYRAETISSLYAGLKG